VAQRHGDKQSGVGDPGEVQEHVEDGGGVGGVGGGGQRINDDEAWRQGLALAGATGATEVLEAVEGVFDGGGGEIDGGDDALEGGAGGA
jgi:hypothetical protein